MNIYTEINEILRALGHIESKLGHIQGELVEIRTLSQRVSMLEQWQSWLKGGWAVLAFATATSSREFTESKQANRRNGDQSGTDGL